MMENKRVFDFKSFIKENYSSEKSSYKKGNIVVDKDNRVALIISEPHIDKDDDSFYGDEIGFELYYRSLGGDIFFVGESDIKELYEPSEDGYAHISSYKSIANKNGFDIIIPNGYDENGHEIFTESLMTYGIEYKEKDSKKFKKASLTKTTHNEKAHDDMVKAIEKDAKALAKQDGWVDYQITLNGKPV